MSGDDSQNGITLTKASVACPTNDLHDEEILTKVSFTCPADNCGKKLKTKQTLNKHMDKLHKVTQLDSPARLALFRMREDGDESSVQGNSNGEVNSPKVVSAARYVCSICDKDYPNKAAVIKHIADDHSPGNAAITDQEDDLHGDEEALEEECELYESLEALTVELKETDGEHDNEEMLRKIKRFQVLVKKKTTIQEESNHEIKMLKQVEVNQKTDIDKKDKEIAGLKKSMQKVKEKQPRTGSMF